MARSSGLRGKNSFQFSAGLKQIQANIKAMEENTIEGIVEDTQEWVSEVYEDIIKDAPIRIETKENDKKANKEKKDFKFKYGDGGDLRKSIKATINGELYISAKQRTIKHKVKFNPRQIKKRRAINVEISVGTAYGAYQHFGISRFSGRPLKYTYHGAKRFFITRNIDTKGKTLVGRYKLRVKKGK